MFAFVIDGVVLVLNVCVIVAYSISGDYIILGDIENEFFPSIITRRFSIVFR